MERMSVKEASKVLHMSEQAIRVRMERNLFEPPIGKVFPSLRGERKAYYIYRPMLENYLGGNEDE